MNEGYPREVKFELSTGKNVIESRKHPYGSGGELIQQAIWLYCPLVSSPFFEENHLSIPYLSL